MPVYIVASSLKYNDKIYLLATGYNREVDSALKWVKSAGYRGEITVLFMKGQNKN